MRAARWLEETWQDCRYALRTLRQKPGFAAVALLTLGLGTGATTVMFTAINGVLLKPLPYPRAERLVRLQEQTDWSTHWGNLWDFTYSNFLDCRHDSRSLDMAAWRYNGGTVSGRGNAEYVDGFEISSNLFSVLRVRPASGRGFRAEEDRLGAPPVILLSYGLWQRRYAGSPSVVGSVLDLEGKPYTIVGVAPTSLRLGGDEADVYIPLGQDTSPAMQDREAHRAIHVVGRLRPGATLAQAQMELGLIGHQLAQQYPKSNEGRTFVAQPLKPEVGDVRSTLWLLLGAVSLVLLIACVNVASLLLARAVSRERELAMRAALGATRGRLVRQCLTESAVLGIAGGVLGILLAFIGKRPFVTFWPGTLPRAEEVHLDGHVLLFAVAVSLLSGLLFGLAPAVRAPAQKLEHTLRAGARTVVRSSRRLHGAFVIAEVALSVILLVAPGMLGRTLLRLSALDTGVNVRNVLVARMALSPGTLANTGQILAAWRDVLDRARRVPGVESAAMVDTVPMREGNNQIGYWTTPAAPPDNQQPLVLANSVTPDYLKVMGIQLRRGRFLDDRDRMGSEPVVVVDEMMAQQAFKGHNPIGQHLWIGLGTDPWRVVGVVGHVRYWGPASDDRAQVRAQLYYPFAQVPDQYLKRWSELMSIALRTTVPPLSVVEAVRHAVQGVGGDQVIYEVRTMEQLASATLARQRFLLLLFGLFAGLALLLACIGIYGVLAYLVGQRVPEIGVRLALGASSGEVMWMVLRQSLGMIFVGVAIGTCGALTVGRVLERLVVGMQATGPIAFVMTIPILVAAALAASFIPARRASRIDPMKALRAE